MHAAPALSRHLSPIAGRQGRQAGRRAGRQAGQAGRQAASYSVVPSTQSPPSVPTATWLPSSRVEMHVRGAGSTALWEARAVFWRRSHSSTCLRVARRVSRRAAFKHAHRAMRWVMGGHGVHTEGPGPTAAPACTQWVLSGVDTHGSAPQRQASTTITHAILFATCVRKDTPMPSPQRAAT